MNSTVGKIMKRSSTKSRHDEIFRREYRFVESSSSMTEQKVSRVALEGKPCRSPRRQRSTRTRVELVCVRYFRGLLSLLPARGKCHNSSQTDIRHKLDSSILQLSFFSTSYNHSLLYTYNFLTSYVYSKCATISGLFIPNTEAHNSSCSMPVYVNDKSLYETCVRRQIRSQTEQHRKIYLGIIVFYYLFVRILRRRVQNVLIS